MSLPSRTLAMPALPYPEPQRDPSITPPSVPAPPVTPSPTAIPNVSAPAPASTPAGASTLGPLEDVGEAIAVDGQGNVLVAGLTRGELEGASGSGDAFVSKWSADGAWLWTRQYGGTNYALARAIAAMPDGDIVIGGSSAHALGQGAALGSGGRAFVARLDPDGEPRWTHQFDGDYASAVAVSADGLIYAASVEQNAPSEDTSVAALYCFDGDGALRWRDQWGGTPGAESSAIATRDGVIDVVGRSHLRFDRTFWGDGGSGAWSGVGYVRRYEASGQLRWERTFDAKGTEAHAVAIDPNLDSLVAGRTFGALSAEPNHGAFDAFIARLDADGNTRSLLQLGTLGWDDATGIALRPDGDLLVAGDAVGELDGDPSTGNGAFFLRGDPDGHPRAIRQGFAEVAMALAAGPNGEGYATGWLFSPSPAGTTTAECDAYVARFGAGTALDWQRMLASK